MPGRSEHRPRSQQGLDEADRTVVDRADTAAAAPHRRPGGGDAGLAEVVAALQRENEGLRRALRTRAVIEQAKGIFMERRSCSADEAFAELRRISQRENARLVEVAATIVGVTAPEQQDDVRPAEGLLPEGLLPPQVWPAGAGSSGAWRTLQQWPGVRAAAVGAIVQSLASAAEDGDEAARLIAELSGCDAEGACITATREDESLENLGVWGYQQSAASAWRRIPLQLDLAMTEAAKAARPIFLGSEAEMVARFPASKGTAEGFESWACVPVLTEAGTAEGVIMLSWRARRQFDAAAQERIVRTVQRLGPMLVENIQGRDPNPRLLGDLLRLNPDPWLVLSVAPGQPAEPQHLVIETLCPDLRLQTQWAGVRLLAAFPRLAAERELLADFMRVLRDDAVLLHTIARSGPTGAPWDRAAGQLRAVRSGGRVVVTWRERPEADTAG
jgi:hypothetical protein